LFQRVPAAGQTVSAVGMPLRNDPFDEWGRRIYSMNGPRGKTIDVVQGITEITPRWTKVEAIEGINHYIWTMKIATSSIPREQLTKILARALDSKDADQRLRIVRLYLQAERFTDARQELEQFVKDFPNRANHAETLKQLQRLGAELLLKEIELRLDAGQFRLGTDLLAAFPTDGVPGETLLKVRESLDEIKGFQTLGHQALKLIDTNVAAFKGESTRADVQGIVAEIKAELNVNTLDRMADFLRLADDASMSPEQKVSLAISGWLMGSGAAIDNLGVSSSLVKVRDLVRQRAQGHSCSARFARRCDSCLHCRNHRPHETATRNVARIIRRRRNWKRCCGARAAGCDREATSRHSRSAPARSRRAGRKRARRQRRKRRRMCSANR
jgi:hypothetical protein